MKTKWNIYKEAQSAYFKAKQDVGSHDDGFLYALTISSYGSHERHRYRNEMICKIIDEDYNGDNGYVHVVTNNPNHTLKVCGDVTIDLDLKFI
jgi:phosphomevalonate kinase